MKFWIVTPSLNQVDWLRLCVASVADQACEAITVHHHVQDGGSTDQTLAFLAKQEKETTRHNYTNESAVYSFSYDTAPDDGMYDAVNRGFTHADDTVDVVAYLNCDEQYLPGALRNVAGHLSTHRGEHIVFADVLVIDDQGALICTRQVVRPFKYLIQTSHLPVFTAAAFVRRRALLQHQLLFDTHYRDLGDAYWVLRVIDRQLPYGILKRYTTAFTDTGQNMNLSENAAREKRGLEAKAKPWIHRTRSVWITLHRLQKTLRGAYWPKTVSYAIYLRQNPTRRVARTVTNPSSVWWARFARR